MAQRCTSVQRRSPFSLIPDAARVQGASPRRQLEGGVFDDPLKAAPTTVFCFCWYFAAGFLGKARLCKCVDFGAA
eukprot:1487113-Pyramimonas_sp.AAC.1